MNKRSKIGIFDSGLGGISVLKDIHKILPNEDIIYIGDSANAPYGIKTKQEVYQLSRKICEELIENDCKIIVIACNTATSAAVNRLRQELPVPIIGMEPAVKPALVGTEGKILVLATEMTLKEEKFNLLLENFDDHYRVIKEAAPEWVDLVENHLEDQQRVKATVKQVLDRVEAKVNAVVLGCTHFIFLKDEIDAYYQQSVDIYDGNMGTATHLRNTLISQGLQNDKTEQGTVEIHNSHTQDYLSKSIDLYHQLK